MAQHQKKKGNRDRHTRLPRSLSIGEESELEIAIYRTERVLDATDLELQPVTKKVTRLGALPLVRKRGRTYEAAVRQTDALAINVKSAPYQFKLMINVGGVNVANPLRRRGQQMYYVSPLQEWIDGVCIARDRVRQFVALPSGTGHSIANQLKRLEDTGEIEIQVFAPRGIFLDEQNRLRYYKKRPTPIEDTGHGFFVTIRTATRTKHAVYNLKSTDPIWHLKACIQDVLSISGLKQELAFLGKDVSDREWQAQSTNNLLTPVLIDKTLLECGIGKVPNISNSISTSLIHQLTRPQGSSLVLTTAGDDPTKKASARAEGEVIEMLKGIEKARARLCDVKEDLSAAASTYADITATAKTELEKRERICERMRKLKYEMEALKLKKSKAKAKQKLGHVRPKKYKQDIVVRRRMDQSTSDAEDDLEDYDSTSSLYLGGERNGRSRRRAYHQYSSMGAMPAAAAVGAALDASETSVRTINVAPGGRIAQTVERDPDRLIWNNKKPIRVWRVKIVDYDVVRDTSGLLSLPRLKERPQRREGPPSLDKSLDTSGLLSVANSEAKQPSSVPFGVFAGEHTLPPVRPVSTVPTTSKHNGVNGTASRQARVEARAVRARREARQREVEREADSAECQCGCM
ncbi:hypothetical protein B0H67DRAFT_595842 [Lasiosphaeris hirsuta]|uniref:Uncharacterized protein n=1 Tax=Lasiosphaeris hirsuta TaxID=260670 RepID=A0AA39ZPZ0_9PEZI|nr:hypothetical protein B0H67DRAFT_595842 [Lasiosphaeris hirsuta]